MANQDFITALFKLLQTDLFGKCVKVLKKLLTVSKHAKSLQHTNRDDAINMVGMSGDDRSFLQQIIVCLQ